MTKLKLDAQGLLSDASMVLFSLSELGCFIRLKCHSCHELDEARQKAEAKSDRMRKVANARWKKKEVAG